jgi:hypothetical protein
MTLAIIEGTVALQIPSPAQHRAPDTIKRAEKVYDGNWWLTKEVDERNAFMWGVEDCLVWVAHMKALPLVGYVTDEKITRYYKAHTADRSLSVLEVWGKVAKESPLPKSLPGGEVWTNPHGFLDGTYWKQLYYDSARQAFLEGYLWCMQAYVATPTETYSRPVAYYVQKISSYVERHPEADDEAIADILSRFRDGPREGTSDGPHQ